MTHALDWKQAHQALIELSRARGALDAEEGTLLLAALRSGTHRRLGYASFAEYIERSFGHGSRWTQERLRVAEALERLPRMKAALGAGELVWSAVRELTRVATPDNEAQWLEVTAGRSVRDIERLVAGHAPGARPDDPPEPGLVRHVLRFEVTAEVLATFRHRCSSTSTTSCTAPCGFRESAKVRCAAPSSDCAARAPATRSLPTWSRSCAAPLPCWWLEPNGSGLLESTYEACLAAQDRARRAATA